MRAINGVNFSLTTHCNMSCPFCCAGITATNKKDRAFYDIEYFRNASKYFYGMNNINITGGEPAIHPKFEEFAPLLKDMFGCKILSIWTNGTMFKKKTDAFKYFDVIHVSDYGNAEDEIRFIKELYPEKQINVVKPVHVENQGSKMCFRGYSDTVEFVDGFIFPCSSGSGTKADTKIPLSDNWRIEILKVIPACYGCVFGEK